MADRGNRPTWTDDELDAAMAALHRRPDPVPAHLPRASAALVAALAAQTAAPSARGPRRPPARSRRRRSRAVVGAAAAAAVVAVLVVVNPLDPGAPAGPGAPTISVDAGPPTASAAELALTRAATATVTATDPPLGPGQYRYVSEHAAVVAQTPDSGFRGAYRTQTWIPADETREWTRTTRRLGPFEQVWGTPEAGAADLPSVERSGPPEGEVRAVCGNFVAVDAGARPSCEGLEPLKDTTSAYLATLPRDPQRLLAELTDDWRPADGPAFRALWMVQRTALLLRSGLVPADLRAAMYGALALLPQMRVADEVVDLDGRRGTALGVSALDLRWDVIIDPVTGAFIGDRQVQVVARPDGAPAGTVLGSSSVTTGVVDAVGTAPPG